ncbi:Serine/threonine-protein kinase Nek2, variant 2 [Orbilia oligospora]|uniref:non-specific serine/threonine protein kinase n=1 Tax=Orbilia oligospora TaxID=2813651 RepID=A0A7C8TVV6_ORBOL|nr:Serine/threonine-protein kinase Nek2, variant 2 [Orbilia oligospora]TGJ66383.1 Serine/threonine-protein kinase Nek2, variant 2 [Orbilia oligospora]
MIMACKAIDCLTNPSFLELGSREIHTWASFSASEKYIAGFAHDVAWTERTQTLRLYMKLYEGGDLRKVITECRHQELPIHPFMATYWAMEIARGLKACHDHGIIHRDLKPANVLLDVPYVYNRMLWGITDGRVLRGDVKTHGKAFLDWFKSPSRLPWCHISDFGFGKFTPAALFSEYYTKGSRGSVGTMGYMAPEVLGEVSARYGATPGVINDVVKNDPKFYGKSDVYSFGCLVYNLCTGRPPPPAATEWSTRILEIPDTYPELFREVISKCVDFNPENRPNNRDLSNGMADAFIEIQNCGLLSDLARVLQDLDSDPGSDSTYINITDLRPEATNLEPTTNMGDPPECQKKLDSALRRALAAGNCDMMALAIELGANVNASAFESSVQDSWFASESTPNVEFPPFRPGVFGAYKNILITSRQYRRVFPLLTAAVFNGQSECVELLISEGASLDHAENKIDALSVTACLGNIRMIDRLVLRWGFDINAKSVNPNYAWREDIPIVSASMVGRREAVRRLLELGASVVIPSDDEGKYPLHTIFGVDWSVFAHLASLDDIEVCARMIYDAAPQVIRFRDGKGRTPLHLAVGRADTVGPRFVKFLIDRGANPYTRDVNRCDAYHVTSIARGHGSMVVADVYPEVKKSLDGYDCMITDRALYWNIPVGRGKSVQAQY